MLAEANIIFRLAVARPIFVGFNVTNRCTMRCPFCNVPALTHRDMTMPEIEHALDRIAELGVPVVGITGGEPFVRKDLCDIVAALARRRMKCTVVTNGDLFDRARAKELRAFDNIVHFALSVDTLDRTTYRALRGRATLPESLARYLDAISAGPATAWKLNIVVGPENVTEIDDILRFGQQAGLYLSFIPMNIAPGGLHRGRAYPSLTAEAREEIAQVFLRLRERKLAGASLWDHRDFYTLAAAYMRGERMPDCHAGELFLDLRSDGKLAFCNEMDHFADLLAVDHFRLPDLRRARFDWAGRIEQCRLSAACCYTCSYNVAATAANIPAYVWDYLQLKRFRTPWGRGRPRSGG